MSNENAPNMGLAKNRFKSCWSFGNPYSLRFLDDPPADPPPADPPASLMGADGALVKDWHKQAPEGYEDLREDPSLATVKNFWGLSKNFVNTKKKVGAETIIRPNEHFTDADWDEFHKAGGRPETAADYSIKRHEEIPKEAMTDEMITGFQDLFHKIGLSKEQSDAIVDYNDNLTLTAMKTMAQQDELDFNNLKDSLVKKWGMAYDQKAHLGNIAIEKGMKGDLDFKERLIEKINKDPDLIEFASNLGSLFSEHGIVEDSNLPTPADMDTKINEAMAHPAYMDAKNPQHERQVQLVKQLTETKVKNLKRLG